MQDNFWVNKFSRWLNGDKVRIDHWGKGEPNSYTEWCVTTEIHDGKWHDVVCHRPEAFICKLSELTCRNAVASAYRYLTQAVVLIRMILGED